jgi:hypothetical protein
VLKILPPPLVQASSKGSIELLSKIVRSTSSSARWLEILGQLFPDVTGLDLDSLFPIYEEPVKAALRSDQFASPEQNPLPQSMACVFLRKLIEKLPEQEVRNLRTEISQ